MAAEAVMVSAETLDADLPVVVPDRLADSGAGSPSAAAPADVLDHLTRGG